MKQDDLSYETISLAHQLRPVLVSFPDITLPVLVPYILYVLVEIKIKFAVNNGPGFRIDVCRGPTAYGIGSVAAVLRNIFFRVFLKQGKMIPAGEKPPGALPFMLESFLSFNRTPNGEIGHRIVPFEGDAIRINIDGCYPG